MDISKETGLSDEAIEVLRGIRPSSRLVEGNELLDVVGNALLPLFLNEIITNDKKGQACLGYYFGQYIDLMVASTMYQVSGKRITTLSAEFLTDSSKLADGYFPVPYSDAAELYLNIIVDRIKEICRAAATEQCEFRKKIGSCDPNKSRPDFEDEEV